LFLEKKSWINWLIVFGYCGGKVSDWICICMIDGRISCFSWNSKANKQMQVQCVIICWRRLICQLINLAHIIIHMIIKDLLFQLKQQGNTNWDLKIAFVLGKEKLIQMIDCFTLVIFKQSAITSNCICIHIIYWNTFCLTFKGLIVQDIFFFELVDCRLFDLRKVKLLYLNKIAVFLGEGEHSIPVLFNQNNLSNYSNCHRFCDGLCTFLDCCICNCW